MENVQPTETAAQTEKRPGRQWGRLAAVVGVIALLVLVGFGLARAQQGSLSLQKPAPEFSLSTFDGQAFNTAGLRGKVVVVNFWASWCKPCEAEAADLENAWQLYRDRGDVVFLGVAWTDTEKNSLAYLDRFGITYPNGPDLGTRISQKYRITGVPETYIIDKTGKLAYFKLSGFESVQEIQDAVDPLLK